jgi:carboxypeptidase C (cathepsin A)
MFELKTIHPDAVPKALERAHFYRLLNEPGAAESICLDVLEVEPDNQQALITMLTAMTDRFNKGYAASATKAQDLLARIQDEYQRAYYAGLICERQARARLQQGGPGATHDAYEWLRDAMEHFEKAESVRPDGNDDSILRWNACARVIMANHLTARAREASEPYLE